MTEHTIVFRARQAGKTYDMMSEMQELILAGRHSELLLVVPNLSWLNTWQVMWRQRFAMLPFPEYVYLENMLRVRGHRYSKVYVEDVDQLPEGIYDIRLQFIEFSALHDADVTYTCSPIEINSLPVSQTPKRRVIEKLQELLARRRAIQFSIRTPTLVGDL